MSEKLTRKSQLRMAMERAKQQSGMTQEEADARYLKLSGGTMAGAISLRGGQISVDPSDTSSNYCKFADGPKYDLKKGDTNHAVIDITSYGENLMGGGYDGGVRLHPSIGFARPGAFVGFMNSRDTILRGVATPAKTNDAANKQYVDQRLPAGSIILWLGTEAPTGWTLCDGSNGAPNLPAPDASVSYIMKL